MKFLIKFFCVFVFYLLFLTNTNTQQLQRNEIISAYLYNFAKNIQWQNEDLIKEFHFLVIGRDESLIKSLQSLSKTYTLRNKPIIVSASESLNNVTNVQLIFVTKDSENKLVEIFDKIEGENILLVSDGYKDKQLIMINFKEMANETVQFEINRANIINQHLRIMEDIIFWGGTEVDVAYLYKQGQQSLRKLQKQAEVLENKLLQLESTIDLKTKQIQQQKDNLAKHNSKISEQQIILDKQSNLLKNSENNLSKQIEKIEEQQKIFDIKSQELEDQKEALERGKELLSELNANINKQNSQIEKQTKVLAEQGKTISRQQDYMYLLVIIIILVILLVFVIYRGYKNKQGLSKILVQKVKERTRELKKLNEELEERVKERTLELQKSIEELNITTKSIKETNLELVKEIETRKIIEEKLTTSEKQLESILSFAPILVYINNIAGQYIFVNKEFEKLMEVTFEEVVNKTDLELFSKERAERNIAQNQKVISTKQPQIFENASQKKGGTRYFVDILFPLLDSNNEIYATCGWSLDITDRKVSEQILLEAKERAESADRLKSAFLATMSHELRTPLNSIIGFTGILMKGVAGPLNDEQLKQLGMAKGSAHHLLDLINDVLDISKIEADQLVVTFTKFNFNKMLQKVFLTFQPIAKNKNINLELIISDEDIEISSDERRVSQIFLNLINNAVKFTDKGSIKVDCQVTDKNIITKIIDSGIGISCKDMDKLFKPFSQVDIGLTRNHEGTGLGLSISKKLTEKLNGTISVESEVNVGSIFTVILPK
ncbi:MAG: DUF4154 domain-containing protein [Bacteroidetes bacterium]|nr:DUF4154 domain-containing protein [Bacteroidota bacterium]MBU1114943.1 DUF4154 domain-containing protein [Bacteroidota bacterium]MBU1797843.1 DUF4154 domain-containing protein [Bacteroidota bacterium]